MELYLENYNKLQYNSINIKNIKLKVMKKVIITF